MIKRVHLAGSFILEWNLTLNKSRDGTSDTTTKIIVLSRESNHMLKSLFALIISLFGTHGLSNGDTPNTFDKGALMLTMPPLLV